MEIEIQRSMREVPSDAPWIKREPGPEMTLYIRGIETDRDRQVAREMLEAAMAVFKAYQEEQR